MAKSLLLIYHVDLTLGGNSYDWKDNNEFNLMQDVTASRVLFNGADALTQIHCFEISNCMEASVPEVQFFTAIQVS